MTRLIRLLTPNNWVQPPYFFETQRISTLSPLTWKNGHSEFAKWTPTVQGLIASGCKDYAKGLSDQSEVASEGKRTAAAYQLVSYANGFGVHFEPDECPRRLTLAADGGSQKAHEELPKILQAFNVDPKASLESELRVDDASSMLSSSWASDLSEEDALVHIAGEHNRNSGRMTHVAPDAYFVSALLNAAKSCNYVALEKCGVRLCKANKFRGRCEHTSPEYSNQPTPLFESQIAPASKRLILPPSMSHKPVFPLRSNS